MNKKILNTLWLLAIAVNLFGQQDQKLSYQDTLRGTVTKEREWWDVQKYEVSVTPDYTTKSIQGTAQIHFKILKPATRMQIDLQQPMQIRQVTCQGQSLSFTRDGNVYYVNFNAVPQEGTLDSLTIEFGGTPREAVNPPWDGGWIWTKDRKGRPWMSVACQGLGASVWYPCKDHQGDEPDKGATLNITVPDTLTAVGNGRLREIKSPEAGLKTFSWSVSYPINTYNIIPYIGKYVHWQENFSGRSGNLDLDYWVLDYELEKAKKQFQQVPKVLSCFEQWLGPFPFYEDGFKLVQSPHLGMEHQSAIAYGNGFMNGYLGRDLSRTGWGLNWDYIIVHETGHEWFGNNITTQDIADMWVHEAFTTYTEVLYTTCADGVEAGNDYAIGLRKNIQNDGPIIGPYGVNQSGSHDMYFKGANIIHTVRQLINDDEKFRSILTGLNEKFRHQIVTTQQVEAFISEAAGMDLSRVFDQYLRTAQIPVLEYRIENKRVSYRWTNCISGFDMPLKVQYNGKEQWIQPTEKWTELATKDKLTELKINRNFYVESKQLAK